jgi:tRNA dimethylallyltransferase
MKRAAILALVGATATGKTELAERLAGELDAEIVCADSRQVFRELDVGTGKPPAADRARSPHHLFEALSITERPSAGWYAREAARVIGEIRSRGRTPLLVGGAGLYLHALREGLAEEPALDPAQRERLRVAMAELPAETLHARLAKRDPESAGRLRVRDRQRVSRALEIVELSGRPMGWWHARAQTPLVEGEWRVAEIRLPVAELARRIEQRTRWMFDHGLADEARALVARGLGDALRRLRAVGYDEALEWLAGRLSRAEAEQRTTVRTRQLAKRQRTWFRHQIEARAVEAEGASVETLLESLRAAFAPAGREG